MNYEKIWFENLIPNGENKTFGIINEGFFQNLFDRFKDKFKDNKNELKKTLGYILSNANQDTIESLNDILKNNSSIDDKVNQMAKLIETVPEQFNNPSKILNESFKKEFALVVAGCIVASALLVGIPVGVISYYSNQERVEFERYESQGKTELNGKEEVDIESTTTMINTGNNMMVPITTPGRTDYYLIYTYGPENKIYKKSISKEEYEKSKAKEIKN